MDRCPSGNGEPSGSAWRCSRLRSSAPWWRHVCCDAAWSRSVDACQIAPLPVWAGSSPAERRRKRRLSRQSGPQGIAKSAPAKRQRRSPRRLIMPPGPSGRSTPPRWNPSANAKPRTRHLRGCTPASRFCQRPPATSSIAHASVTCNRSLDTRTWDSGSGRAPASSGFRRPDSRSREQRGVAQPSP